MKPEGLILPLRARGSNLFDDDGEFLASCETKAIAAYLVSCVNAQQGDTRPDRHVYGCPLDGDDRTEPCADCEKALRDIHPPNVDPNRCAVCGWPLVGHDNGCARGDCSMRPLPPLPLYDRARAIAEYGIYAPAKWKDGDPTAVLPAPLPRDGHEEEKP